MQNDEEWKDAVIDPVNVLGVNNISFNGIEILLWFKTEPGTQFALGREFRRRLKYAFDRENIDIGIPQHSFWYTSTFLTIKKFSSVNSLRS